MQVTQLEKQKNNPERVNVFVDGKFFCSLPLIEVVKNHLKEGLELGQNDLEILWLKNLESRIKDDALNFLSFRPRSVQEVREYLTKRIKKLKEKTYSLANTKHDYTKMVEKVVEFLREKEFVNDVTFAVWWINQRQEFKQKGKRLIEAELFQKGVSKKDMEQAWLHNSGADEFELAKIFVTKKLGRLAGLDPKTKKEKVYSWLTIRGFSYDVVKNVIDTVLLKD